MCVCFEHKEQINSLLSELETVQLMGRSESLNLPD